MNPGEKNGKASSNRVCERGVKIVAEKNNANIGFEKQIWDAACVLWGHIPAAEYRKVIVGLIFMRYISSAFERRYQELVAEGDGFEDDRDAYTVDTVFNKRLTKRSWRCFFGNNLAQL